MTILRQVIFRGLGDKWCCELTLGRLTFPVASRLLLLEAITSTLQGRAIGTSSSQGKALYKF